MEGNKIKVTIDAMGNPKIEGVGFSGTACDRAMAPIEAALAGTNVVRENKPEYNEIDTSGEVDQHMTWSG